MEITANVITLFLYTFMPLILGAGIIGLVDLLLFTIAGFLENFK